MYMLLCYNRRPTATPNVSLFRFIFFCPSFQCFATGFAPLLQFCKHHIFFNTVVDDFDNFSVDVRFDFSHSFNLGQDSFARIGTSTTSHAYFKFCARHVIRIAKILVWFLGYSPVLAIRAAKRPSWASSWQKVERLGRGQPSHVGPAKIIVL